MQPNLGAGVARANVPGGAVAAGAPSALPADLDPPVPIRLPPAFWGISGDVYGRNP